MKEGVFAPVAPLICLCFKVVRKKTEQVAEIFGNNNFRNPKWSATAKEVKEGLSH